MIEFIRGLFPHNKRQLLAEAFEQEYRPIRLRSRAKSTVETYRITLRFFDRFLDRPALLSDLRDDTVSAFLEYRIGSKSPRTVNRDLVNLQAMADWFWKRKRIPKTLTELEPYIAPKMVPHALTMEEISRVWDSIADQPGHIGRVPSPIFLRALFLVFWDTGERFTAVTSIRVSDVSLKSCTVFLRGATRKGGRSDRVYPLSNQGISAIDELLGELGNVRRSSKLFHVPYSKDRYCPASVLL